MAVTRRSQLWGCSTFTKQSVKARAGAKTKTWARAVMGTRARKKRPGGCFWTLDCTMQRLWGMHHRVTLTAVPSLLPLTSACWRWGRWALLGVGTTTPRVAAVAWSLMLLARSIRGALGAWPSLPSLPTRVAPLLWTGQPRSRGMRCSRCTPTAAARAGAGNMCRALKGGAQSRTATIRTRRARRRTRRRASLASPPPPPRATQTVAVVAVAV
mmetsp:Transcript_10207/g.32310  ORF Transcript_10207/g.32310 Transcript_10207/m.32310 type:complete len:213 (-) Transcript_10207:541-1179(-)